MNESQKPVSDIFRKRYDEIFRKPKKPCFEMTADGCVAAREYLKSIGRLGDSDAEQSTDGYTLVAFANSAMKSEEYKRSI